MTELHEAVLVGLGDPVMDVLVTVSHEELADMGLKPGGCLPVDARQMQSLLDLLEGQSCNARRIPGGSAANVVKGVALISGGTACCKFLGMVGSNNFGMDATGTEYRAKLVEQHVQPLLLESTDGEPSAVCLCLLTPDGQRTMRTCHGASRGLTSAEQLPPGWADGCQVLHCSGYCLYRPQLAREAMTVAKAAGARVSIDLASFEVHQPAPHALTHPVQLVRNCYAALCGLLEGGLLDVVFANEEEALALGHMLGVDPGTSASSEAQVAASQDHLLRYCHTSVVTLGARGCVARSCDGAAAACAAAEELVVVDSVGAGDFFAAGFLSAHLAGGDLARCCAAGCAAGGEAVQATGAQLDVAAVGRLRAAVAVIMAGL